MMAGLMYATQVIFHPVTSNNPSAPLQSPSSSPYNPPLPAIPLYSPPFLPFLSLPLNPSQAGILEASKVMSIPYIISACLSPVLGGFVDRFGYRAVIATVAPLVLVLVHGLMGFSRVDPVGPLVGQGLAYRWGGRHVCVYSVVYARLSHIFLLSILPVLTSPGAHLTSTYSLPLSLFLSVPPFLSHSHSQTHSQSTINNPTINNQQSIIQQPTPNSAFAAVLWPSVPLVVQQRYIGLGYGVVTSIQNGGLAAFPLIVSAIDTSTGGYIPSVEVFFVTLACLGVAVGVALNVWDGHNGNVFNRSSAVASGAAKAAGGGGDSKISVVDDGEARVLI